VYSLSCVLFACLTGRPPFTGSVPEVIQGHLNQEPPAATSFATLPTAIDAVLRRGMSKKPTGRYPNCRELIAAAGVALAGSSGTWPPRPEPRPAPGPAEGRSPMPPAAAQPVRLRPPAPARPAAFGTDRDSPRWLGPALVLLAITVVVAVVLLFVL